MLQWIQSLSWVIAIVNGLKQLFSKSKPVVEEPAPVVEPPVAKPAAKRPRKRRPAKPKQQ